MKFEIRILKRSPSAKVVVYNSSWSPFSSPVAAGASASVDVAEGEAVTSAPSSTFSEAASRASTLYLPFSLMKFARSSTVREPEYSTGESLAPAG
jgi:hypothetical protein